jgi:Tol biopolymer transport system component
MILFSRNTAGRHAVYRVAIVGGEPRKLVDDAEVGDWSPDGRRIAYLRSKNEGGRTTDTIELAGADGSDQREVARIENHRLAASDGRRTAVQ